MSNLQSGGGLQWGTYLDVVADVKPWMQYSTSDTTKDAALQLVTDAACSWIQGFLGSPLGSHRYDMRVDGGSGWMGTYIMLPRVPVLEIVSCIEYRGIAGPFTLTESTPTQQVDGWQCEYETGKLARVFPGNVPKPWFPGVRNIEIVWSAGYNPVPPQARLATLELVAHWFRSGQQQGAIHTATGEARSGNTPGPWGEVPERITDMLGNTFFRIGMA
jgi:hypothetical protein